MMMMIKHQMDDECSLLSAPIWLMTVGTQHYHFEQKGLRALVHECTRARGVGGEGAPIKRKKKVGDWKNVPIGFRTQYPKSYPSLLDGPYL